ncbi:MAG: lipid II flippase MurJ [bacterium]
MNTTADGEKPATFAGERLKSGLIRQSLVTASLVTIGTNVAGRLFGYLREATIAGYFGTSADFDTFILAFTVPELFSFIIFAALPSALIPFMRQTSPGSRSRLFWEGLFSFVAVFGFVSIMIYLLRAEILALLAPALCADQRMLGEKLLTILSGFVFFRGMEAYFRACLYDRKHFVVPSLSPIIANVVVLTLMVAYYGELHIEALAYGWLLAAATLLLMNGVMAVLILKPGWPGRIDLSLVKPLLKATTAVAAIESVALIYPVVDRFFAARYLGEGQIAALRYAAFLVHIPTGMFAAAFALASFPWISDLSAPGKADRLQKLYGQSLRLIAFVMLPAAMGIVLFSREIVRVAFQRGVFDVTSADLTHSPLVFFALGVVFFAAYLFQMRFYYASASLRRLGLILLSMLTMKIIISLALVNSLEQDGLALATSFTWLSGFLVMTLDLHFHRRLRAGAVLLPFVVRVVPVLAGVGAYWMIMANVWPDIGTHSLWNTFLRLALLGFSGALLYLLLAALLRLPEPRQLLASISSKIRPSGSPGDLR